MVTRAAHADALKRGQKRLLKAVVGMGLKNWKVAALLRWHLAASNAFNSELLKIWRKNITVLLTNVAGNAG